MSDNWLTPPRIVNALGPFDLDPCTPPEMPWETAVDRYSLPQDGLVLPWHGRVWLNPPYGKTIGQWTQRLAQHGCGTALVFARTDTAWFAETIWRAADALLFLRGRLFFHLPDGSRSRYSGGMGSVLAAYGRDDMDRLAASGLRGQFIPLPGRTQLLIVIDRTWLSLVKDVFSRVGQEVHLDDVYARLKSHPKTKQNQHWRAKVRQQLQLGPFKRLRRAVYRMESN